jgi:hypothetical protein
MIFTKLYLKASFLISNEGRQKYDVTPDGRMLKAKDSDDLWFLLEDQTDNDTLVYGREAIYDTDTGGTDTDSGA